MVEDRVVREFVEKLDGVTTLEELRKFQEYLDSVGTEMLVNDRIVLTGRLNKKRREITLQVNIRKANACKTHLEDCDNDGYCNECGEQ